MELNDAQMKLLLNLLENDELISDEVAEGGFISKRTLEVMTREVLIGELRFFLGGSNE